MKESFMFNNKVKIFNRNMIRRFKLIEPLSTLKK